MNDKNNLNKLYNEWPNGGRGLVKALNGGNSIGGKYFGKHYNQIKKETFFLISNLFFKWEKYIIFKVYMRVCVYLTKFPSN